MKNKVVGVLTLLTIVIWLGVLSCPDNKLHIISCDVGQGDATLIIYKNNQILIDGGPDKKVINCLSKYMPFWDREIELVVLTHPDSDHFVGLIDVIKNYHVDRFIKNSLTSSDQGYQVLESLVGGRGIGVYEASRVRGIGLGLIHLDIVPTNDWLISKDKSDNNASSVVLTLKYLNFKAIFTGDVPAEILEDAVKNYVTLPVNYIKLSHHGSKTGTSEKLLSLLEAKIAIISVGAKNRFGHPSKEVLEVLEKLKIKYFRTDSGGNIETITDGAKVWTEK